MTPRVVCCDPGVDDAVALAALAGMGVVPDRVVAHGGNVPGRVAARVDAGAVHDRIVEAVLRPSR